MTVRMLPSARAEFLSAAEFYEAEADGLGSEFIDEFERAIGVITSSPQIGSPYRHGTRRKLLRRFPYQIIYEPHADHQLIVAVAHHRKRPDYWDARDS